MVYLVAMVLVNSDVRGGVVRDLAWKPAGMAMIESCHGKPTIESTIDAFLIYNNPY